MNNLTSNDNVHMTSHHKRRYGNTKFIPPSLFSPPSLLSPSSLFPPIPPQSLEVEAVKRKGKVQQQV